MRESRKFFQRGPTLAVFFSVDEKRDDQNTTSVPKLARQSNAKEMVFLCHAYNGLTVNAGLVAL